MNAVREGMKADDETTRLRTLLDYRVLDSAPEQVFDNIVTAAARIFTTPISLVTLVDADRQWFKARYGLEMPETPRDWSFCAHAVAGNETLIVPDATKDPRFQQNPLVLDDPHIRFYCGVPLRSPDGYVLGTLCIIDREPRTPTEPQLTILSALARQVELELELRRRLVLLEDRLSSADERRHETDVLLATIIHDLRSPLTTISLLASAALPANEESRQDLEELLFEAERMRHMLTDVLDICLHEAGGLQLRKAVFTLGSVASTAVRRQLRISRLPPSAVRLDLSGAHLRVHADPELIHRVLENLLSDAVERGERPLDVSVGIKAQRNRVLCEVRGRGAVVPAEERQSVFDALARGKASARHRGYGLGLTFCRRVIEAHGGTVSLLPLASGDGNCFTFDLPAAEP